MPHSYCRIKKLTSIPLEGIIGSLKLIYDVIILTADGSQYLFKQKYQDCKLNRL